MQIKSLFIGGILPTILLGVGSVLIKLSMREGSSVANYLIPVGMVVLITGLTVITLGDGWISTPKAICYAAAMGLALVCAIAAMTYAVSVLDIPLSILAPLTNSNTLVAVALSALIFGERQALNIPKVLLGTLLVILGACIVTTAKV